MHTQHECERHCETAVTAGEPTILLPSQG